MVLEVVLLRRTAVVLGARVVATTIVEVVVSGGAAVVVTLVVDGSVVGLATVVVVATIDASGAFRDVIAEAIAIKSAVSIDEATTGSHGR